MQNYSDSLSLWNNLTEITALCSGLWRCRLAAVACYPACKYILWSGSVRVLRTGHQEPQSICLSKRKRILFHFPLAIRVWKSCCPTRQKCGLTDSFRYLTILCDMVISLQIAFWYLDMSSAWNWGAGSRMLFLYSFIIIEYWSFKAEWSCWTHLLELQRYSPLERQDSSSNSAQKY